MKFLANENFPIPSVKILRSIGLDVKNVGGNLQGISDHQVIEITQKENLIILTFDKDYGELIFRLAAKNPPSVVFFRHKGNNPEFAGKLLTDLIEENKIQLERTFTVIEEHNIRQRQYS